MGSVSLIKAITHKGSDPADLVGKLVRVRPYYCVPDSPWSLKRLVSEWTFEARVTRAFPVGRLVTVEFDWWNDCTPWQRLQIFYPHELHNAWICECRACKPNMR